MADDTMPTTYDTKTTTQTTTTTRAIGFYPEYLRTIPGILKVVEIVLSIVTFICAVAWRHWYSDGGGWVQFVSMTAFLSTALMLLFYLLGLYTRLPGIRIIIEFIYYCVFSAFFLIASIVAAANGSKDPSIGATAFFSFAATAVYGVDTFFQFRAWRTGQSEMTTATNTTTTTTSATTVEQGRTGY